MVDEVIPYECPFCGADPVVYQCVIDPETHKGVGDWIVECEKCALFLNKNDALDPTGKKKLPDVSRSEAIEWWNRRVKLARFDGGKQVTSFPSVKAALMSLTDHFGIGTFAVLWRDPDDEARCELFKGDKAWTLGALRIREGVLMTQLIEGDLDAESLVDAEEDDDDSDEDEEAHQS